MMPRTLRGLILLACAGVGALTILLGGLTHYLAIKSLSEQLNSRIAAESHALLAIGAKEEGAAGIARAVQGREGDGSVGDLGYMVLDARGRRVGGILRAAVPPPGPFDRLRYIRADGSRSIAQSLNSAIPGGGRLVVVADRSVVEDAGRTVLILFGATFGSILLFGVSVAWMIGRAVRIRLARIASTADAIMAGDLTRRMPIDHERGEFDQLSMVINRMLDRIEILLENLKRLSIGIAHDIRSPLNRARGRLEAAEQRLEGLPQQAEVSGSIADLDEVLDLVRALLGISEIEGIAVRQRFVPVALAPLAEDVVDGYRPVVESAGLTIACEAEPVMITSDAALLRRSIANLIDNAILYTPEGTHIVVSVEASGDRAMLRVSDTGPGVPIAERENIFSRFVRLDSSRSTPGHGLGLHLVATFAAAHDGVARVMPTPVGLTIEIELPIWEPARAVSAA